MSQRSNKKTNIQVLMDEEMKEKLEKKLEKKGFFSIPDFYRFLSVQFIEGNFEPMIKTSENAEIVREVTGKEKDDILEAYEDYKAGRIIKFKDSKERNTYLDNL